MVSSVLSYFPCIHQIIDFVDMGSVVFDPSLRFRRSTFRNRMIISGPNGPIQLSIPIIGGRGIKSTMDGVKIDYKVNWQRDHFRTLVSVYGNAPFFTYYKDELDTLFNEKEELLFYWNLKCLKWMLNKARLTESVEISLSTDVKSDNAPFDTPDVFLPKNYNRANHAPFLKYPQVFEEKTGFLENLSMLDLLFALGPDSGRKISDFLIKPY